MTWHLKQFEAIAEIPDRDDDEGSSADMRTPQINYFIGLAYEAMGKKTEAKAWFTRSKDQVLRRCELYYVLPGA